MATYEASADQAVFTPLAVGVMAVSPISRRGSEKRRAWNMDGPS
jgi:hypothetical protein